MSGILLKVNGISSLTDARYCAGMGVQKLGLNFDQNGSGSMDPNQFSSVKAWIEGVSWIGTYFGTDIDTFKNLVAQYQIVDWVLLPELLMANADLTDQPLTINLKVNYLSDITFEYQSPVSGFEISTNSCLFQDGLEKLNSVLGENKRLYLEDIPNPEFVLDTHHQFPEIGFILVSGEEERPGWMDLSDLQDMLEQLEDISGPT